MAYQLPVFNVQVNIWRGPQTPPPSGSPDLSPVCNLALGKRVTLENPTGTPVMYLLCPANTDIRSNARGTSPDFVEAPAGSNRYYDVLWVDNAGTGFPNEHVVAILGQALPWGPVVPNIAYNTSHGTASFTADDTWTVPAGVQAVNVFVQGAGGDGSAGVTTVEGGAGGGGGASAFSPQFVSTGDIINIVVGVGGNPGGDSHFATAGTVMAKGGTAAVDAATPGLGGTAAASIGTVKHNGGDGGLGETDTIAFNGGGGGGSGGFGGAGGVGSPGLFNTGGLGGAAGAGSPDGWEGGSGAGIFATPNFGGGGGGAGGQPGGNGAASTAGTGTDGAVVLIW